MGNKSISGSKCNVNVEAIADSDLVVLRAALEVEMKRRGIAFSIGDIGEHLVIKHFRETAGLPNLQSAPRGTKNVDALSRNGDRYSIKTIWNAKKTGTIYPDTVDSKKQLFERLLIVRLNDGLALSAVYEFSWEQFLVARRWDKRMSAWYVPCSGKAFITSTRIL